MTHDRWQVVPSPKSLKLMMLWWFGGKRWLNESFSDGGVCRTAASTPGLLNTQGHSYSYSYSLFAKLRPTSDLKDLVHKGRDHNLLEKNLCFQEENQYLFRVLYMTFNKVRENLVGNKFFFTLRALYTNITVNMPIFGVIGHQPGLN